MRTIHKKNILIISIIIGGALLLSIIFAFNRGITLIKQELNRALEKTEKEDFYKRLTSSGLFFMNENETGKIIGGISYIDKNDEKHSVTFEDSISIEIGYQLYLQGELAVYKPIDLNDFDSLFQCNINPHIHISKTGIIYRNEDKIFYSNNDSISSKINTFVTEERTLDINNKMHIKGWARINTWQVFMAAPSYSIGIFVILLMFAVGISLYGMTKKEEKEIYRKDEWTIFSGLKYNIKLCQLFVDGTECSIRPADLNLLHLFVTTPNHQLTKEDIALKFWPKEDAPDGKIYTHINTLKKVFTNFPSYHIEKKGKHYTFIVDNLT